VTSVAVAVTAAYFAALAALLTDAAHIRCDRNCWLRGVLGDTVFEASEDCRKLLNVLLEGRTALHDSCDTSVAQERL